MAAISRAEVGAVYAAAVIQGVVLVTFPAVSAIFLGAKFYALTKTEYGGMFVPQAIAAIVASLAGAGLARKLGGKSIFLLGLVADVFSMLLLFASNFALGSPLAYELLLAATGCLGVGFGFVVPALNTFTAAFFPSKVDTAILTLNALLGLGTALAPVFAAIFVGFGFWWGLPALMLFLLVGLIAFSTRLPLATPQFAPNASESNLAKRGSGIPARFLIYAGFALLYGICETMSANWAPVYLSGELGASERIASFALTGFWVSVTAGRILFAALERWIPARGIFAGLAIALAPAYVFAASAPRGNAILDLLPFCLTGLFCSALLPLVISLGQGELRTMTTAVAGGLIGFYQAGYGLAAFGVGPLEAHLGLRLGQIYLYIVPLVMALAVGAVLIARRGVDGARGAQRS